MPMKDFNLENRRLVIGGIAITIVVVYIIRLFSSSWPATTIRRMPTPMLS